MVTDEILMNMFQGIWISDFFHFVLIMILFIFLFRLYERFNTLEAKFNNKKVKKMSFVVILVGLIIFAIIALAIGYWGRLP